ncbi:MAG: acyltransferase [Coriobacteriales bacterium]|nr:acyltransferase [Coriobacteriales bacterium]
MSDVSAKKPRNHSLDFVKGIACMLVVCMHCEFPGYLGTFVQCISRFAVPFFFMVSGYFCFRKEGKVRYTKKIKHILFILIFASIFYLIVEITSGHSLTITNRDIKDWLLFNEPAVIAAQLWFMFALLYDYILFGLIDRAGLVRLTKLLIPLGLLAYACIAYGAHFAGIKIPNCYYRNFLTEGLPLFSLGYWIRAYENRIHVSNVTLTACIALFTLLCPLERGLIGRDFGIHLMSFPQVICIFLFCIKNPAVGEGSWLANLGLKYSLYVYVLHPFVWHMLERVYKVFGVGKNVPARFLMPILCIVIAIAMSMAVVGVLDFAKSSTRRS